MEDKINQICKSGCKNEPVFGSGILSVFTFCCVKGFNLMIKDITKRYKLK